MKLQKKPWNLIAATAVLLAFGAARTPVEHAAEQEWRQLHLHAGNVDLSVRDQLGQMSFVAVLGGFRSLVASFLGLEAFVAWENVDWGKLESDYHLITTLQPRVAAYWDEFGWHLAYNASVYYAEDESLRLAIRDHLAQQYIEKGIAVLREGARNNPEDYLLLIRLGQVLRSKREDPCAAAEAFEAASTREGAPAYSRRFAAYEMSECPGREREAYARLAALYREGPQHHKRTLITKIVELEKSLNVPLADRVPLEKTP
jgi:hypothetical protein